MNVFVPPWVSLLVRRVRFRVRDGARVDSQYVDLGARLARGVVVRANAVVSRSTVGEGTYINHGALIFASDVGPYCSLGPACQIGPNEHLLEEPTTSSWLYATRILEAMDRRNLQRTTLAADVWVGSNAVVLKGRRIGVGAVVAAGAVVTADVAPYTIVGGVPARVLGERFDEGLRSALVESQWWTRGSDGIRRALAEATRAGGDATQRARTFLGALR